MKDIKSLIDNRITFIIDSYIEYDLFVVSYIQYIKSMFGSNINIHTELNKNIKYSYKNYDICLNIYNDDLGLYFTNIMKSISNKRIIEISDFVFALKINKNGIYYFTALKNRYSNETDYFLDLNKFSRLNKLKYILNDNN